MQASQFNKKYKISNELAQKVRFQEHKDIQASSIAGKPKKMWLEIIKRLFSNPIVVISIIVFIAILLCSIIISSPSVRWYTPNHQINKYSYIAQLPPLSSPNSTIVLSSDNRQLEFMQKIYHLAADKSDPNWEAYNYLYGAFASAYVEKFNSFSDSYTVTYNAYELYYSNIYNQEFTKYLNGTAYTNAGSSLDAAKTIKASVVPLHTVLGTTTSGYDIWTTTWYATYRAIKIALITAVLQAIIGISIGAYLGFNAGKLVDTITMRLISIFTSPPTLIWILILVAIFGANEWALILALVIVGWPGFVGETRMFIITVKNEEYIGAAKSIGASTSRQIFIHALPAIVGKIANSFVKTVPGIILWIASLAFLGFFKETNDTNLGQLLIEASSNASANIWVLVLPTLILLFLSLSLNFIALGIHDALDPKVITRGKRN